MSELADKLTLGTLERATTVWHGNNYNVLKRRGQLIKLELDRDTWERMGRPVDMDLELTATTKNESDPTMAVLIDAYNARLDQIDKGYTPEHDDEHGLEHILSQAGPRRMRYPMVPTREELVRDAGILVAAIEWMDRNPDGGPQPALIPDDPADIPGHR